MVPDPIRPSCGHLTRVMAGANDGGLAPSLAGGSPQGARDRVHVVLGIR